MGIFPALERVLDELNEGRVRVIVERVSIDVTEHKARLWQHHRLVEVYPLESAPLHPEGFDTAESGLVKLVKAEHAHIDK